MLNRVCTVITPVLNGAATLPVVYSSLSRQNIDVHWYVVDDGSEDSGVEWLRGATTSPLVRITALQTAQSRSGPGSARMVALRAAASTADWVTFVDADDSLEDAALEAWVARAERMDVDVLVAPQPDSVRGRMSARLPTRDTVLRPEELWNGESFRPWGVYGKLYRGAFLAASPALEFPAIPEAEDAVFYVRSLIYARRVGIAGSDVPRYRYHRQARSAMHLPMQQTGATVGALIEMLNWLVERAPTARDYWRGASPILGGLAAIVVRAAAHPGLGGWAESPLRPHRTTLITTLARAMARAGLLVRRDLPVIFVALILAVVPLRCARLLAKSYVALTRARAGAYQSCRRRSAAV